jgi:methyl-accepting chemotaxis protein
LNIACPDEGVVGERRSFRYRTNRSAKIFLSDEVMDCFVRDLSDRGARIEIANAKRLPQKFIMRIEGMTERHRCRVAWRTQNMIGIEYL